MLAVQVQYRMHPSLSRFPSQEFYSGRLLDGVTAEQRPPPAGTLFPQGGGRVLFVDVQDGSEVTSQGGSKVWSVECGGSCTCNYRSCPRKLMIPFSLPLPLSDNYGTV